MITHNKTAHAKNKKKLSTVESNPLVKKNPTLTVLTPKLSTHNAKSGLNPLVDAAAYLFSIMGKLKNTPLPRELNKLHKELVQEINHFQEAAKNQHYSSEYILVGRFAICATLDDIIQQSSNAEQGQWDSHSLLSAFNQENGQNDRFFILLERISKDPAQYIDLMELMYICLSLGFKGHFRSTEFGVTQLEQITHALYKRIRNHRGESSKILSPYPLKPTFLQQVPPKNQHWLLMSATLALIFFIFMGFGYIIETASYASLQELNQISARLS